MWRGLRIKVRKGISGDKPDHSLVGPGAHGVGAMEGWDIALG